MHVQSMGVRKSTVSLRRSQKRGLASTLIAHGGVAGNSVEEVASESPGELATLDSPTLGMCPVSLPHHHKLIRISWGGQLGNGELDKLLQ